MKKLFSCYSKNITTLTIFLFMLLLAATKTNAQWIEMGGSNGTFGYGGIFSIVTDASGNVYAAGGFTDANDKQYVAKWNGTAWSELGGTNGSPFNHYIKSIAIDVYGNVYAGGLFNINFGFGLRCYVAEWNGTSWSEVGGINGSPINSPIESIATDAAGNVYAAGDFTDANYKNYVAKWDGASWSELGGTNGSPFNQGHIINSIATDVNGNVYAGGYFKDAIGNHYVAKWNGSTWGELGGTNGSPFNKTIWSIATDAEGNVYAGGAFTDANNNRYVAKWDGTAWSELGGANGGSPFSKGRILSDTTIYSIAADAAGNVYVGGNFTDANGKEYVAKWNGMTWSELGSTNYNNIETIAINTNGNIYAPGSDAYSHNYVDEYAQSSNIPITVHIVNPNPNLINSSGTIYVNTSQIDTTQTIASAATDGITKLLLVTNANYPLTFSVADNDGSISSLADQNTLAKQITIAPDANGKVVAVYNVPDGYGITNPVGGRNAAITIADAGNAGHYTTANINLVTPPLVMVHGMWSDPSIWDKSGFTSSLAANGIRDIYLADYSQVNASTFDPDNFESFIPRMAVQVQIDKALNDYHDKNIAVTQVDVVGHSLGGLMARSSSQQSSFLVQRNYYKGFVHKLITLGTPHRGSPLGPELYKYKDSLDYFHVPGTDHTVLYPLSTIAQLMGMPIGSCHKDFGITSQGIVDLSTTLPYRTFAITADHEGNGSIPGDITGYVGMEALSLILFHKPFEEIMESRCNTGVLPNDLIVPYKSQTGYINSTQIFYGTCHSIPGLLTETNNPLIQEKIAELLLSDDTTEFSVGFPAPSSFPLESCDNASERTGDTPPTKRKEASSRVAGNPLPTGKEYVQISTPARGVVYHQNIDTIITVGYEPLGGAIPTNALLVIKDIGWYKLPTTPPYSTTVTLPKNIKTGSLNMILMVSDTTGTNLVDTSHITFLSTGIINAITIQPTSLLFDSLNRQTKMLVQEKYTGIYGTYISDISSTTDGVTYTTQKGNSIIKVAADGTVTGVSTGVDTLTVQVDNSTFKVPVLVDSNFLSRTLYPNIIDFADIPNKTQSDAPFALDATATSGENVNFTLISGPVEIANGVVIIKGTGLVTIQATCSGNVYFNSAAPVTKTFYIGGALPLQLLTFTGSLINNNVLLNWTTANEVNTSYFIVERSSDGISFTDIDTVKAIGGEANKYGFTDHNPANGINYYRLQTVDKNGSFTYSPIRTINEARLFSASIYPNPVQNHLSLNFNSDKATTVQVQIVSIEGKIISTEQIQVAAGISTQNINIALLSNGEYYVRLVIEKEETMLKFLKER